SLYPRSAELLDEVRRLGALGATISGAGPTVLVWCRFEQTGGIVEALTRRTREWATVMRAPFESQGADVRSLG
ncbi:MAG TPA: homoserine kinase, partial [Solirubrobacteraceae bacterium]|nr:homoserine kinase [Solirubrobacteraceae bacterium]